MSYQIQSELIALALVIFAPLIVGALVVKAVDVFSPPDQAAKTGSVPTLARDLFMAVGYVVFIAALVIDGLFKVTCGSSCKPHAQWTDALLPAVALPLIVAIVAYKFNGGAELVRRLLTTFGRARQY